MGTLEVIAQRKPSKFAAVCELDANGAYLQDGNYWPQLRLRNRGHQQPLMNITGSFLTQTPSSALQPHFRLVSGLLRCIP